MKIAFINGSPKTRTSASNLILQELKPFIECNGNTISEYHFSKPQLPAMDMQQLAERDVLVFAFPLYVDGIPSHLLNCLVQLETFLGTIKEKDTVVYSLVNCGFFEGHQNDLAIELMQNWCVKAGLKWGQGVGIGAGGMLPTLGNVPIGHGPLKNLGNAFDRLSDNILKRTSDESIFISPNFPRIAYKLAAELGWRRSIKANGLKTRDISLRK